MTLGLNIIQAANELPVAGVRGEGVPGLKQIEAIMEAAFAEGGDGKLPMNKATESFGFFKQERVA